MESELKQLSDGNVRLPRLQGRRVIQFKSETLRAPAAVIEPPINRGGNASPKGLHYRRPKLNDSETQCVNPEIELLKLNSARFILESIMDRVSMACRANVTTTIRRLSLVNYVNNGTITKPIAELSHLNSYE